MSEDSVGKSLIVVANRLPVDRCGDHWSASPGGLVSALAPVVRERGGIWVGWTGACDEHFDPFEFDGISLEPVALSSAELREYYEGFSNATIWPLYHDQVVAPQFHRSWWNAYQVINERFAAAVARCAAPGATVWIHDYQLQLVPNLLRQRRPDVAIGYFSHIPFPPSGLFSQLPWRDEILSGLLGADVIGFQRESDVTNFSTALDKLAPKDSRRLTLALGSYPISIDVEDVENAAHSETVLREAEAVRADLGSPETLLLGVDRLDHTKGIIERLLAYEELLDEGALDPCRTCLVQVAVPSREGMAAYQELRENVEQLVGRINGKFAGLSGTVVHYLYRSYTFESTIALYLAADALLVTALRDGMNLVAKEYVCARRGRGGALVLSEFAGAADELTEALLINPHNLNKLKSAITQAVEMDAEEANSRIDVMADVVTGHDVHDWARHFLDALES
ncbi:trehalose-6-phosphate synthase [Brevibacterium sp. ZH18]|uniref:alpha,alpha-trehalose-phosphate synthase (UDP-forming) n=1 Tax=Brevibacterium sp. ZH18 TaxID=2927784 RepID=UPI001F61EE78|nr:trehalose-6-phosphate synthase [Brevibacterium sp. ZH18]MCI4010810.1 trehalose-6-phosphate synthase [Brevibacterium sp. ZH18]